MAVPGRDDGRIPNPAENHSLEIDASAKPPPTRASSGSTVLDEGAIEELGRTYHHYKPDSYLLPNDADEQDRLDLQHKVTLLLLEDKLHLAPLQANPPRKALDVGTGTGIWAINFAKQYPDCEVTGSDLSLIQPKDIVPNCFFIRDDAEDKWAYTGLFDYIHFRLFCPFVKDIRAVIQQAHDQLEPGGFVEFQEVTHEVGSSDDTHEGTSLQTAAQALSGVGAASGRNPWAVTHVSQILTELGFIDVVEKVLPVPIGSWPKDAKLKELGWWNGINTQRFLGGLIKSMVKSGMSMEQAQGLIGDARKEIGSGEVHAYVSFYIVYARKPLAQQAA